MKDHEIARLYNDLRDTAIKYKDAQQLRARLVAVVAPLVDKVKVGSTYIPKIDGDWCDPKDCPVFNTEWMTCNITNNKCPKHGFDEKYEDHFEFPDDCPAKEGILIKLK